MDTNISPQETAEMPSTVEEPKQPNNKKKPIIIVIVAVIAAILIGVGVAFTVNSSSTQPDNSESNAVVDEGDVEFNLDADGWSKDSSAFIVHVEGKDSNNNEVDFYHAFNKSDDMKLDLSDGKYRITFISAINSDGSIYKTETTVDIDVKNGKAKVDQTFEKVDADKVSADDLNNLLDKINEAISKGDDSLTGDKGKQEVEKAADNAANNNNADKSKVEEKKSEAASKAESTTPTTSKPAQSNSNKNNQSTGSSTQPTQSNTNSGNNSGGNSGNTSSSQPAAHQHNWVAQYKTVHHDAVTQQVPVYKTNTVVVCNVCGARNISFEHEENHALAGEGSGSHNEYEDVLVGYDTQVIQAAYDEQVLTGYTCSSCGATK